MGTWGGKRRRSVFTNNHWSRDSCDVICRLSKQNGGLTEKLLTAVVLNWKILIICYVRHLIHRRPSLYRSENDIFLIIPAT